jgi:2'-5' RNA ligase
MTRLFIALLPSEETRHHIAKFRHDYQDLHVGWLPDDKLHITVIPPWQTDDVDSVIHQLRKVKLPTSVFDLELTRTGYGPDLDDMRLVWATGDTPAELHELRRTIEIVMEGTVPHRDNFLTHMTLGKFEPDDFNIETWPKLPGDISWVNPITSFALMQSHKQDNGNHYYTIVHEFPLD